MTIALPGMAARRAPRVRQRVGRDDIVARIGLVALLLFLLLSVVLPLWGLLSKAFQDRGGGFVGLGNFVAYFATPGLSASAWNSLSLSLIATLICVTLAFGFAYALTRTRMPGRRTFRAIAQIPLLAPSLLPAISLVYLFGAKGLMTPLLMGNTIYGPIGIVIGSAFWTFPHALIILVTALSLADQRLYEAAEALGARPARIFWTVTLPGARFGLISAFLVVFILVITDFGVPKVIGGSTNMLATDIYKQVIGQQNFQMGAVVGILLLLPAVGAFVIQRIVERRQAAQVSARIVPFQPRVRPVVDRVMFVFCLGVSAILVGMIGIAFFASIIKFWPYDFTPSLRHYDFDRMDGGGWASYLNSLELAAWTALVGTAIVFTGAWLVEKTRTLPPLRQGLQMMALLPLAVPGLALGLGYIFFFNDPANPLRFLYHTMAIMVLCTVAHFYAVAHLTAVTALKQMDPEFEQVSASLKVPAWRTFLTVNVPVCLPAILDISMYLFVNAMTTVSAVVFLYSPHTTLAAIAVLNMDDAGDVAPAAAMAMMLFFTAATVRLSYELATRGLLRRAQRWRLR
ncbi:putative 2-aminoethylphosphonate ABC transporter permease subunit [Zavarzinia sp. CC-PAN008]|uniref:putative 2-aminoethylphosphonate ABC transporter permease subunit n=1 Tax=Zavarzinia sp. CC-PAN008 TaxID=3243332 RepID=UPI003F748A79